MIHPFDDPEVIAGQGTIGMEILRQSVSREVDGIFVCCGGGGMLAGIAAYVKVRRERGERRRLHGSNVKLVAPVLVVDAAFTAT